MKNLSSAAEKFGRSSAGEANNDFAASLAAVVLFLAVALPLSFALNIWLDEAWTMHTTANGFGFAWQQAVSAEHQAPFYFVILAAWRKFNDSLVFARLFSICCIAATIWLIPSLLRRFAPQLARGAWRNSAMFVFALHPYTVWAALEARVYALVILLSAVLLLVWFDGYLSRKISWKAQFFCVFLAIFALYTNYYLGFLLFANACALLALRRWRTLGVYVGQMIFVGVVFAPLVFVVKQQFVRNNDYAREQAGIFDGAKLVWNTINSFVLPSAEIGLLAFVRVWSVRLGFLTVLFLAFKNRRKLSEQTVALAVIVAVVSGFFLAAYLLIGDAYVQLRHAAPLFVPVLLLVFAALADFTGKRGLLAWLWLFFPLAATALFAAYSPPIKNGDWTHVAQFIEQNEARNQPITAFPVHDALPLAFSYHGENTILHRGETHDWNQEDVPLTASRYKRQIEHLIAKIPLENERLWIVTPDWCHNPETSIECRPLEDFIELHYLIEIDRNFRSRRVRLLQRRYE